MVAPNDAAHREDLHPLAEPAARPIPPADNPLGVRHLRRFVASPLPSAEPSLNEEDGEEDGDFPVLTEEVGAGADQAAEPLKQPPASVLASDMAYAIEQHLAEKLPALIETTLLNAQEELRSGVNEMVALALHNFLDRHPPRRLPPDGSPSSE